MRIVTDQAGMKNVPEVTKWSRCLVEDCQ